MPTTEGALDMELNMTHVIDGFTGNEHNFPVINLYSDVTRFVGRSGLAYTPTLLVLYGGPSTENFFYARENPALDPKLRRFTPAPSVTARTQRRELWARDEEHVHPQVAASAKRIVDAGGLLGVGAHGQLQGLGFHWELWAVASGGLSNAEALRSATRHGARIVGVEQDLGSLETGKLADVLVLERNPLENLRHSSALQYVIKDGVVRDAETLDQVWPEAIPHPRQWWQPVETQTSSR